MTVFELIAQLEEAIDEGMGDRDVVIPAQTGGSVSVTEVEMEDDDFLIRLS
jgi:hypothetical protein